MPEREVSACENLVLAGFPEQMAAEEIWDVILGAGLIISGKFTFAAEDTADIKVEAERLYKYPRQLQIVLGYFASFPCISQADVLLPVPDGWTDFTNELGEQLEIPVAQVKRKDGSSSRYDFEFVSTRDRDLALSAKRPRIAEDVVTTLGSVAGVRRLLRPDQDVHSLAMLLRDEVNPGYQTGLVDHYLLKRYIPKDKTEFSRLFPGIRRSTA